MLLNTEPCVRLEALLSTQAQCIPMRAAAGRRAPEVDRLGQDGPGVDQGEMSGCYKKFGKGGLCVFWRCPRNPRSMGLRLG